MKSFKIALAQFSPYVGDIESNVQKMIEQANNAKKQNAEIVVFPELSIIGYPAEDLLLRPSLTKRTAKAFEQLPRSKTSYWSLVLFTRLKMVSVIMLLQ